MTTTDLTRTHQLAQESYQFMNGKLTDHIDPIFTVLKSLGLDRAIRAELENVITAAVCGAEHEAFIAGFTFSSAIANVPPFSTDPMDKVLRPDRYIGA